MVHVYVSGWVCPHMYEGEWLALQRGGREVVTHQLTAQTAHVDSTGGDKQVLNVHTCTHIQAHTYTHTRMHTHTHTETAYNTLSSQCPHACTHRHTHTCISTHEKVTQITFTHSRCPNVISSLTSIFGLLSVHSGQWSSCCNQGSASGPDSTGELSPR